MRKTLSNIVTNCLSKFVKWCRMIAIRGNIKYFLSIIALSQFLAMEVSMIIEELNSRNFSENVLESSIPVVVDFFATWCSPCKALAPVLVELAKEYDGKIKFFKLNIDEEEDLAREFGIMSIPTLALFKNGKVVNQSVGLKPIEVLRKFITI